MKPQTEKEKQYNRMAMQKVRSDVRAFVEKGQTNGMAHLGEYPRTMEDAVRTIIALQDMLEVSMDKHAKATGHLMDAQAVRDTVVDMSVYMLNDATENILQSSEEIGDMRKQLTMAEDECNRLVEGWHQADIIVAEVTSENTDLREQLAAALDTLKVVMNR